MNIIVKITSTFDKFDEPSSPPTTNKNPSWQMTPAFLRRYVISEIWLKTKQFENFPFAYKFLFQHFIETLQKYFLPATGLQLSVSALYFSQLFRTRGPSCPPIANKMLSTTPTPAPLRRALISAIFVHVFDSTLYRSTLRIKQHNFRCYFKFLICYATKLVKICINKFEYEYLTYEFKHWRELPS